MEWRSQFLILFCSYVHIFQGLPWWLRLQCRRSKFDPWVVKIPWRREWQPTPVFLPGEFHRRRSLVGYCPRDCKESDMTEQLILSILPHIFHRVPSFARYNLDFEESKWFFISFSYIQEWWFSHFLYNDSWVEVFCQYNQISVVFPNSQRNCSQFQAFSYKCMSVYICIAIAHTFLLTIRPKKKKKRTSSMNVNRKNWQQAHILHSKAFLL